MSTPTKMTSLQILLNQQEKDIAEKTTQSELGLSLASTIKLIIKTIVKEGKTPLKVSSTNNRDETEWLLNSPGYGQTLIDSVEELASGKSQIVNFDSFEQLQNNFKKD
ncbi:MAG: hypothetical protein WCK98_02200 [bacterium]